MANRRANALAIRLAKAGFEATILGSQPDRVVVESNEIPHLFIDVKSDHYEIRSGESAIGGVSTAPEVLEFITNI